MIAYLKWIGKDVLKDKKPKGAGLEDLPYTLTGPLIRKKEKKFFFQNVFPVMAKTARAY